MADVFLELKTLGKRFGAITALEQLTLELAADELLVVLGPTGAGKTTLLRTIAGLETPDEGEIWMAGQCVNTQTPAERDVALVFQNFSLYPTWSVRKNMAFPLRAPGRRLPAAEIDERIHWAAELLHITHLLERRASRLSGGEMQRVAIGRAIVRRPRLFLMDEPLTNLDAKLREELRVELVRIRRQLERPMIYVTHDQTEALSMGDRIVVLSEGRILQVGSPQDIYRRPSTPEVALQLGQPPINIFNAVQRDGAWQLAAGTVLCVADGDAEQAVVGVRPEDIELVGGSHEGSVRVVEEMGAETILVVDWAGQHIHILCPRGVHPAVGDTVAPKIAPDKITVWPSATVAV